MNDKNTKHRAKRVVTPEELVADAPRSAKITEWKNPTSHRLVAEFFVAGPTPRLDGTMDPSTYCLLTVEPGACVSLPSEFDAAIHQLDRDGRVIGGLAPLLRKVGAPEPRFAPGVGS